MQKLGIVLGLTIGVVLCYIIMLASQPAINSMVSSANASTNWTGFEVAGNALNAYPLYMWFIPGGIYIIVITIYLKYGGEGEQSQGT